MKSELYIFLRFRCLRAVCCPCGPLSPALLVLAAQTLVTLALTALSVLLLTQTEAVMEAVTLAVDTKDRWKLGQTRR